MVSLVCFCKDQLHTIYCSKFLNPKPLFYFCMSELYVRRNYRTGQLPLHVWCVPNCLVALHLVQNLRQDGLGYICYAYESIQYRTQRKASPPPPPPPPSNPPCTWSKQVAQVFTSIRTGMIVSSTSLCSRFHNNIRYFTIAAEIIVHSWLIFIVNKQRDTCH